MKWPTTEVLGEGSLETATPSRDKAGKKKIYIFYFLIDSLPYYLNLVIFLCPQFHLYFSCLLIILENLREKYKKLNRHASLLRGKRSFPETDFKSSLYQYCSPVF